MEKIDDSGEQFPSSAMAHKDPRVDTYIREAVPFARPILRHLRRIVHAGCPEARETIKWQFPHFECEGILCAMAGFKEHCALHFWKGELILPRAARTRESMGHFGRLRALADLPDDEILLGYVRKAAALNKAGVKKPARLAVKKAPAVAPADLKAALRRKAGALRHFEVFTPSQKREYIEWITEAKRAETRLKRVTTAAEWISQGKKRNWKFA